jgi:hypothetical protein
MHSNHAAAKHCAALFSRPIRASSYKTRPRRVTIQQRDAAINTFAMEGNLLRLFVLLVRDRLALLMRFGLRRWRELQPAREVDEPQ